MIKPYESYKYSGIKWIGDMPSKWSKIKIGRSFSLIGSGTTPKSSNRSYYSNGTINWLNTGDLNDSYILNTKKKVTQKALDDFSTLKLFPKNSIVIALYGATIGKLGQLKISTSTNQACCVLSDSEIIKNRFLFYFLLYSRQHIISLAYGGGQPNISQELIKQMYILAPSLKEQTQISKYLDYQTNILDQLIEKKEKLVTLLKKQRQAIINETVTKGLNPNAKMKDSRIEWLGDIPEGWELIPLRYLGDTQNGVSKGGEYFGSGDPFINYSDVYKNLEIPLNPKGLAKSTDKDKNNYSVLEGDVFFTRTSETIDEIGIASTAIEEVSNAVFAGFLIRFRPLKSVLYKGFSKYYFRSFVARVFFVKEMNLVTRASLSQDLLKGLPVCLPTILEQKKIAKYLDEKYTIFNNVIIKTELSIEKYKEYRKSIISEAVTGKIDLREWKAPIKDIA